MSHKVEFKRGFRVLVAAFLGISIGITSLYFYTVGLFIKPLQAEFDWSRSAISSAILAGALVLAATSPLVGALADRFGVRLVAGLSLLGLSGGFFLLSGTSSSFVGFLLLTILLHVLGAGTTPVVFTRMINQWFDRARGLALGIALAGTGITGALAPRLIAGFLEEHGWRTSYQLLALVILLLTPLVIILIKRHVPAGKQNADKAGSTGVVDSLGLTFDEVIKSKTFWMMAFLFFCVSIALGGIVIHLVPLLTDAGVPVTRAATIAGALGASVILGRVLTGILLDRYFAPRIVMTLFSITAGGCIALAVGGADLAVFAAVSLGFSMGAEVDFIGYMVARYFGLKVYGEVYGLLYAIFILGMSFSPMLVGFIYDTQRSYDCALWLAAGLLITASVAATRLPAFPSFQQEQEVLFNVENRGVA